jgi:hypothetical protein
MFAGSSAGLTSATPNRATFPDRYPKRSSAAERCSANRFVNLKQFAVLAAVFVDATSPNSKDRITHRIDPRRFSLG